MCREILLDQKLVEAPAEHLWHSEHKISEEEVSSASENLGLRCAALGNMKAFLGELGEYQQGLEKAIDLYKGVLCPIHRLPDEVLQEIFIHFCEDAEAIQLSPNSITLCAEEDPVGNVESNPAFVYN
ncbi:hypothetical protein BKA70DRAFT_1566996 [Coprinopsis sp. MPI-PUGE-AT-0042]|nr:hypothetical protein BKA70DRAFT_1566996 [Coprinopsis sp. MPI-PUGE-AT-0042]